MKNYFYMPVMLNSASFSMSTYVRELRPSKTESGSDTSSFLQSIRNLWEGGKTESGLHCSTSATPSRLSLLCLFVCRCTP